MGTICGCSCFEKHYDNVYTIKKREITRIDEAKVYIDTTHSKNTGNTEVEGTMHLLIQAFYAYCKHSAMAFR